MTADKQKQRDTYFIKEAFKLALKAEGFTSPNPLVGAVIVKNNKIISKGYHKKAGLPHAEIQAIKKAKTSLKGATLYVNLEPCFHFGRTPPCVDEIIRQKFKRVVIAVKDPNPEVNGKSIKKLKKAGVQVDVGLCQKQAVKINEVFFKNIRAKRPFVVAKTAQSLDGKTATFKGLSKWITTPLSRKFSYSLRDKYDCVLIGANTLKKDNPGLAGLKKIPFKAVVSRSLNLPFNSRLFKEGAHKLIVFTSDKNKKEKFPASVKIFFLKEQKGVLALKDILKALYSLGIMSVFVEGGSQTLGHFFESRLVDKAYFFISPKIIAGQNALSSIGAKGFATPKTCPSLKQAQVKRLGEDFLIWGYPEYI